MERARQQAGGLRATRRGPQRDSLELPLTVAPERLLAELVARGAALVSLNPLRDTLEDLRRNGTIGDEAYHRLEEEIDWTELAASPPGRFQPLTT